MEFYSWSFLSYSTTVCKNPIFVVDCSSTVTGFETWLQQGPQIRSFYHSSASLWNRLSALYGLDLNFSDACRLQVILFFNANLPMCWCVFPLVSRRVIAKLGFGNFCPKFCFLMVCFRRRPLTPPMRTLQWAPRMNRVRGMAPPSWRRRSLPSLTQTWPSWMTWSTGTNTTGVCMFGIEFCVWWEGMSVYLYSCGCFVSRPRWVVPVLPKGELEVLLEAAIELSKKGKNVDSFYSSNHSSILWTMASEMV